MLKRQPKISTDPTTTDALSSSTQHAQKFLAEEELEAVVVHVVVAAANAADIAADTTIAVDTVVGIAVSNPLAVSKV